MAVELFAAPLFVAVVGFLPVGLAIAGKANLKTACKIGFLVGIVLLVSTILIYILPNYLAAAILGVAALAFLSLGIFGITESDLPTIMSVVGYTGVFLLITGGYVYTLALAATGLVLILLGIQCILGALVGYGKAGASAGWAIVLLVLLNSVVVLGILSGKAV